MSFQATINIVLFLGIIVLSSANVSILQDPVDGVALASDNGINRMLNGISWSADFFILAQHVDTQINQAFCGVSTTAAILNSFNGNPGIVIPAPISEASTSSLYYYFDQSNSFSENQLLQGINASYVDGITGPGGLTLDQLASFISDWGVNVITTHGHDTDVSHMRISMKNCLQELQCFVTANFLRSAILETGGGHHSPIGGYDEESDSFLIMDVAEYKYGNFWFSADALYNALNTTDTTVNLTRGFLQVYLNNSEPSIVHQCGNYSSGSVIQIASPLFVLLMVVMNLIV